MRRKKKHLKCLAYEIQFKLKYFQYLYNINFKLISVSKIILEINK